MTCSRHDLHRRHQALHATRSQSNICQGCKKTFSRLDALNVTSLYRYQLTLANVHPPFAFIQRHRKSLFPSLSTLECLLLRGIVRSEGGSECRQIVEAQQQAAAHAQAITQSQGPPLPDHPPGNQPGPSSSTAAS